MLIEEAIFKLLKTNSGVTDRVVGRIFAGVARQEVHTVPYAVYAPEGDYKVVETLDGGCTLSRQTVSVFSAGNTLGQAALTDSAVILALNEFRGTVVKDDTSPEESIFIQGISLGDVVHDHQYVDKTKLHEFVSHFVCDYLDPSRITD